jgi:hypothetical protein
MKMKNKLFFFLPALLLLLAACVPTTAQPIPDSAYTQLAKMATGYAPTQAATRCSPVLIQPSEIVYGPALIKVFTKDGHQEETYIKAGDHLAPVNGGWADYCAIDGPDNTMMLTTVPTQTAIPTATQCPSTRVKADSTIKGPAVITVEVHLNVISAKVPEGISVDFNQEGFVNRCANYMVSTVPLEVLLDTGAVSISVKP